MGRSCPFRGEAGNCPAQARRQPFPQAAGAVRRDPRRRGQKGFGPGEGNLGCPMGGYRGSNESPGGQGEGICVKGGGPRRFDQNKTRKRTAKTCKALEKGRQIWYAILRGAIINRCAEWAFTRTGPQGGSDLAACRVYVSRPYFNRFVSKMQGLSGKKWSPAEKYSAGDFLLRVPAVYRRRRA